MTGSWSAVKSILADALEHPPGERALFVRETCNGDHALYQEVVRLLAHEDAADEFFHTPVLSDLEESAGHDGFVGRRIGQFIIESCIASGGMGTVYRARQQFPDRVVALKMLRHGLASPAAVDRFLHEANVLARMQHAGIAQVFEAGVHEDASGPTPYFAMELIEHAQSLTDYATAGQLDRRRRLCLFLEACNAVHSGHQRGVIHRDLKPENILVDEEGRVKIIDFGIAGTTDENRSHSAEGTDCGRPRGTLLYMSPEQIRGEAADLDVRTDVYSLGVVLFQLLTGTHPIVASEVTPPDLPKVICESRPRLLSSVNTALRGDLEAIVARCLEKDRTLRYQSSLELAQDVQRCLNDEPVIARPQTRGYVARKFIRRNRGLVGGICGAASLLVISIAGVTLMLLRALDAEESARSNLATARFEARQRSAYSDFLHDMITAAEPESARGRDVTVLTERLDAAVIEAQTTLDDLPVVQAAVFQTIGETYHALGLYAQAEPLLHNAVAIRRRLHGDDSPELASALKALAIHLNSIIEYDLSASAFREALDIQRQHLPSHHDDVLDLQEHLASLLLETGRPENIREAAPIVRGILVQREATRRDRPLEYAYALSIQGEYLGEIGNWTGAEKAMQESLDLITEHDGAGSTSVPPTLAMLGWIQYEAGRLDEAEQTLRRCIERRREIIGPRHFAMTWTYIYLARCRLAKGDHEEAESLCRLSIDVCTEALGQDHSEVTDAMELLAQVHAARGDVDEARQLFNEVINRYTDHYGPGDSSVLEARRRLHALN